MEKKIYTSKIDNQKIVYYTWKVKNPKGVLHLVHGSIDYALHYKDLIDFMNDNNYSVYAMDLRGHGETVKNDIKGYFGKDGHLNVLDDVHNLNEIIKKENRGLDITLLGHSMGSFIVRSYITKYNDVNKVIAVGTNHPSWFMNSTMIAISKMSKGEKPGKFINNLSYVPFNKKFKSEKDRLSWLSKNLDNRNIVKASPHTKFIMTNNGFYTMGQWIKMFKDKKIDNRIPVLLLNGSDDPVGKNGKEVRKALRHYKKLGYDVEHIEYNRLRHEILCEDEPKVFEDIIHFIEK